AYYPDATFNSFDKRNVRDGRYALWGYEHLFAKAAADGTISNAKAANLIGWITGSLQTPAFDPTAVMAGADLVPQCAMRVGRDAEGGPLRPAPPASPCGCQWESLVTKTTPASCAPCANDSTCAGKHCSNGFCE